MCGIAIHVCLGDLACCQFVSSVRGKLIKIVNWRTLRIYHTNFIVIDSSIKSSLHLCCRQSKRKEQAVFFHIL